MLRAAPLLLLLVMGCGGSPPALSPAKGVVKWRGRALPGGTIVFTPDAERGNRGSMAVGTVGSDGTFALETEGKPGCVPGWHRVTVLSRGCALPTRYRDPEMSGQHVEIKPGQENACEVNLD
ncbi:MAG: hypothetical protein K2W96_18265 [Gemmataceae bacterium]|nr:hypothetical protein [Gemmataceae bacterium]